MRFSFNFFLIKWKERKRREREKEKEKEINIIRKEKDDLGTILLYHSKVYNRSTNIHTALSFRWSNKETKYKIITRTQKPLHYLQHPLSELFSFFKFSSGLTVSAIGCFLLISLSNMCCTKNLAALSMFTLSFALVSNLINQSKYRNNRNV